MSLAMAIAKQTGVEWSDLGEIGQRLASSNAWFAHETLRASTPLPKRPSVGVPDLSIAQVRWGPLVVRERSGVMFGLVYRAWDPKLDRDVALKVLDDHHRAPDAVVEKARSLARIHHQNVIAVHGAERMTGARASGWSSSRGARWRPRSRRAARSGPTKPRGWASTCVARSPPSTLRAYCIAM